jgi:ribosomal protein S18 acetylase RimI-like enzyme
MRTVLSISPAICATVCNAATIVEANDRCPLSFPENSTYDQSVIIACPDTPAHLCSGVFSDADDDMVEIRRLARSDFESIRISLRDAFSPDDFQIDVPADELDLRLRQNSYRADISVGAFHENAMVGFALSAIRTIGHEKVGFGVVGAVLKEWRRRGIAQTMLRALTEIARTYDANKYMLIVEAGNSAAVTLYSNMGFDVTNSFQNLDLKGPVPPLKSSGLSVFKADVNRTLAIANNFPPYDFSWHNMDQGILETEESQIAGIVKDDDGETLAYGVFQPATQRISRFGIKPTGIAIESLAAHSLLLFISDRMPKGSKPKIYQLPSDETRLATLVKPLGFENISDEQLEMTMDLE